MRAYEDDASEAGMGSGVTLRGAGSRAMRARVMIDPTVSHADHGLAAS